MLFYRGAGQEAKALLSWSCCGSTVCSSCLASSPRTQSRILLTSAKNYLCRCGDGSRNFIKHSEPQSTFFRSSRSSCWKNPSRCPLSCPLISFSLLGGSSAHWCSTNNLENHSISVLKTVCSLDYTACRGADTALASLVSISFACAAADSQQCCPTSACCSSTYSRPSLFYSVSLSPDPGDLALLLFLDCHGGRHCCLDAAGLRL